MTDSRYIDPNTVRPIAETVVDEPSFWSRWWWLPLLLLLGLGLMLWHHRATPEVAVTHFETIHETIHETITETN